MNPISRFVRRFRRPTENERINSELVAMSGDLDGQIAFMAQYFCADTLAVVRAARAAGRLNSISTYPGTSAWLENDSAGWAKQQCSAALRWYPNEKTMHEQWLGYWRCPLHRSGIIVVNT